MRLPKSPVRKKAEPVVEDAHGRSRPAGPSQGVGYRDAATPPRQPPPLTSDLTKSIRFTISEPQGYYFEQVESFVQQVVEALAFYEQADFAWQQTVYEMQVESDAQAYDLQRLRSEIELFKVQGSPLVNADGSYVTESQRTQTEALLSQLAHAEAQVEQLQADAAAREAEVARLQAVASGQDADIVSLRHWGAQVSAEVQSLQAQVVALEAENAGLHAAAQAMSQPVEAIVSEPEDLPVVDMLTPDTTSIEATIETPVESAPVLSDGMPETDAAEPIVGAADRTEPQVEAETEAQAEVMVEVESDAHLLVAGPDSVVAEDATDASAPALHVAADAVPVDDFPVADESQAEATVPVDFDLVPVIALPGLTAEHEDEDGEDRDEATGASDALEGVEEPKDLDVTSEVVDEVVDEVVAPGDGIDMFAQHFAVDEVEPDGFEDESVEPEVESTYAAGNDLLDLSLAKVSAADAEPLTKPEGDSAVTAETVSNAATGDTGDDTDTDQDPDQGQGQGQDQDQDTFDPYAQYDETDEDDSVPSVAVVPVDSELPDGVELPGTGEAAITYPHAAPGVPLDTRGVPVEVWAPELDPRVRAAIDEAEAANQSA